MRNKPKKTFPPAVHGTKKPQRHPKTPQPVAQPPHLCYTKTNPNHKEGDSMKRKHPLPLPEGFTPDSIRLETSTCTGERTIGFFDPADRKLHCAELVRREEDIAAFYAKYGLSRPK